MARVRVSSPVRRIASPARRAGSPAARVASPDIGRLASAVARRLASPARRTVASPRRAASPDIGRLASAVARRLASPPRRVASPDLARLASAVARRLRQASPVTRIASAAHTLASGISLIPGHQLASAVSEGLASLVANTGITKKTPLSSLNAAAVASSVSRRLASAQARAKESPISAESILASRIFRQLLSPRLYASARSLDRFDRQLGSALAKSLAPGIPTEEVDASAETQAKKKG